MKNIKITCTKMSRQQEQSLVAILMVILSQVVVFTQCKTVARAAVGFHWYNGQARQSVYAHNCDFPSTWENQLVANRGSWSLESCSKKCVDTSECTHFVFGGNNNNDNDNENNDTSSWCQLRRGKVSRDMATWTPGTQCGIINQHPVDLVWKRFSKGVWAVGCNFLTGDVKTSRHVSSLGECARLCAANLECTHFVFGAADSLCLLKESNKISKLNAITFPQTSCGLIYNNIRLKPKYECDARGSNRFLNLSNHSGLSAYAFVYCSRLLSSESYRGVLINSQTILISAGFVENKTKDELQVFLGLSESGNVDNALKMNVSRIIKHPNYDRTNNLNDIALLRLEHEVALEQHNEHIQIACLPELKLNDYPTFKSKLGFSHMFLKNNESSQLDDKNPCVVRRLDDTECSKYPTYDPASQFCAVLQTTSDITLGESSKILYMTETENDVKKAILAGLLTSGDDTSGQALVYTRVSYYLDWIYEKFQEMEASNLDG